MWRLPRNVQTTIPCRDCGKPLKAERSCRRVTLKCETCHTNVDVSEYSDKMDDALEDFLGQVPCDRI